MTSERPGPTGTLGDRPPSARQAPVPRDGAQVPGRPAGLEQAAAGEVDAPRLLGEQSWEAAGRPPRLLLPKREGRARAQAGGSPREETQAGVFVGTQRALVSEAPCQCAAEPRLSERRADSHHSHWPRGPMPFN